MIRAISRVTQKYYLVFAVTILPIFTIVDSAAVRSFKEKITVNSEQKINRQPSEEMSSLTSQWITFAADHGVADPVALVAAVKHSSMAHLLISVAIEESLGDPVAVGKSGEFGAWQVIESHWGAVPKDIHGQAGQAEKIISALLIQCKGNKKKALAQYNGGTKPHGTSYRYAERILKRAKNMRISAHNFPPNYVALRLALLGTPKYLRAQSSFLHVREAAKTAHFLS